MEILAYCKQNCGACIGLKNLLAKEKIKYKEINISTPEALTELRFNGIYTMAAPVLQIDKNFYTTKDICLEENTEQIDRNKVIEILNKFK